ncbi:hypothetical protein [Nostoc sp.]|uniref:hypothetical protein n=1 Tax=Nostoc sp. TaxID=1180 RepID=UPI003FA52902
MINTSGQHPTPTNSPSSIPSLESGDRLTRPEFERRYNAMPNLNRTYAHFTNSRRSWHGSCFKSAEPQGRTASSWRFDKLSEVGNFCVSPTQESRID